MISRRITCKPQNDNYRRLANYIADAKNMGEKTLMSWCAGCWAGDDYDLAIQEVLDTQELNQRTGREKTYHLIVSFRPEDEAVLTPDDFKEIEQEFSKALGFEEHQRHCGVHKNTNNIHMHIAYNMIHPEKLTRFEPYRDFYKRDRLHRELEQKFGLKFDNGRQKEQEPKRTNDRAATYEAHSGQQSFDSYVKERKDYILKSLEKAQHWQEFHEGLAQIGIEVRLRGNGCIVKDRHSNTAIKASRLDRDFTKSSLEERLGAYQDPVNLVVVEKERYAYRPLHKLRGELFAEFSEAVSGRKKAYVVLREEQDARWGQTGSYWDSKIKALRQDKKLRATDRSRLIAQANGRKIESLEALKKEMAEKRAELRAQTPFARWNDFLKWKAESGDEIALMVLRSAKEPVTATSLPDSTTPDIRVADLKLNQSRIRRDSSLAWKDKRRLLSIAAMLQLQAEEARRNKAGQEDPSVLGGMTWCVDSSGNVLYTLKSGGMIKDNGDKIFFSLNDPEAKQVAQGFARMMFGRSVAVAGNEIRRKGRSRSGVML